MRWMLTSAFAMLATAAATEIQNTATLNPHDLRPLSSFAGIADPVLQGDFARDDLVAWGWSPGEGRDPASGTQAELGALVQAWIDSGAVCPD
jgi:hypothetical protein